MWKGVKGLGDICQIGFQITFIMHYISVQSINIKHFTFIHIFIEKVITIALNLHRHDILRKSITIIVRIAL